MDADADRGSFVELTFLPAARARVVHNQLIDASSDSRERLCIKGGDEEEGDEDNQQQDDNCCKKPLKETKECEAKASCPPCTFKS